MCLQAYRIGDHAWGTQFHGEVTEDIFSDWIENYGQDPDAVSMGFDPEAHRARLSENIGRWNEIGRTLAGGFLEVARRRAGVETEPAAA